MLKQFTTFTLANISGTTLIDEVPINVNINAETATGYFSLGDVQSANVSIEIDTRVPIINLTGVTSLILVTPLIDKIITKLNTIIDEIIA